MTVKELIEELTKLDPTLLVVLQRDEEGNGYKPARGVDDNASFIVDAEEVGLRVLDEAHVKRGFTEEDLAPHGVSCVVLFP